MLYIHLLQYSSPLHPSNAGLTDGLGSRACIDGGLVGWGGGMLGLANQRGSAFCGLVGGEMVLRLKCQY